MIQFGDKGVSSSCMNIYDLYDGVFHLSQMFFGNIPDCVRDPIFWVVLILTGYDVGKVLTSFYSDVANACIVHATQIEPDYMLPHGDINDIFILTIHLHHLLVSPNRQFLSIRKVRDSQAFINSFPWNDLNLN